MMLGALTRSTITLAVLRNWCWIMILWYWRMQAIHSVIQTLCMTPPLQMRTRRFIIRMRKSQFLTFRKLKLLLLTQSSKIQ